MKIIKILAIAAGLHALALVLIFSNPGCSYTKAAPADAPAIAPAPVSDAPAASGESPTIRFSPTRPGTAVASALETQPVSGVTPATTYTVARGDNLWSIAKANQISRTDLAAANNIGASAVLHVGQKLIIPSKPLQSAPPAAPAAVPGAAAVGVPAGAATTAPQRSAGELERHVVKPGETLGSIARKYGVRQGDIAVANNITDPRRIQPGQELLIPAKSAAATARAPKPARPRAEAAGASVSPPAAAPAGAAPGADQDLDAGLKPQNAVEVPVVKIEDAPASAKPKNP